MNVPALWNNPISLSRWIARWHGHAGATDEQHHWVIWNHTGWPSFFVDGRTSLAQQLHEFWSDR